MAEKYPGKERRKHPRAKANLVISYRITEPPEDYDLTQSKNISQGGILLTTNQYFEKGVFLEMTIRFPFVAKKLVVKGEVISCREVVKNIIYETRMKFLNLDVDLFEKIGDYVSKLMEK